MKGSDPEALKVLVEREMHLFTELERYSWLVFLPLADGSGAYTRYFGRLADGSIKVRGLAARRHDTPEYIRRMQQEMLTVMAGAVDLPALAGTEDPVCAIHHAYVQGLTTAPVTDLVIRKRISRLTYAHRCLEGAAVLAYREGEREIAPGTKIGYVVRDAQNYGVDLEWAATTVDGAYYRALLEKAWSKITFVFGQLHDKNRKSIQTSTDAPDGSVPA
ncbi:MAG: hypothetical protein NTZ39_04110 [Methanoregula sp.]|nr:hypothetical protein [Methanoregula sp.]